jgi:hypothetical protein
MKTKNKQITYQDNDPNSFMEAVVRGNSNGGSMTLEQICARVPGAERRDVVRALKDSDLGVFVAGRKGHPSRWVYGPPAEQEAEKFRARQSMGGRPRRQHNPREVTAEVENNGPRRVSLGAGQTFTDLSLKVSVGGQEAIIPLKVELIPAE